MTAILAISALSPSTKLSSRRDKTRSERSERHVDSVEESAGWYGSRRCPCAPRNFPGRRDRLDRDQAARRTLQSHSHRCAFAAAKWRKSPASGLPTLSGTATGAVWLGAWGQFTNSVQTSRWQCRTCAGLRYSSEGGASVCLYLHRAGAGSGYSVTDTVRAVSTGATPAFRVSAQDYASIEPRL
jgi:hypothetical protein